MAKEYDIAAELKHCQDEVDEAAKAGDIERLKRIIEREGLEWIEPPLPEKYRFDEDR
jgi:hypothetical protein